MERLLPLLLLLAPAQAAAGSPRRLARIVGGSPADVADFPWQLSLHYGPDFWCGASLLAERWALTAARCVHEARADLLRIRGGSSYRDTGGVTRQVATGYLHRGWDPDARDYDFAVIRALTPLSFSAALRPPALPAAGLDPPAGLAATATGFGATAAGGPLPLSLRRADVAVVERAACSAALGAALTARMVCAGAPGRGPCGGDQGGPLATPGGVLLGVASWGPEDCSAPAVYASVGSVRQWIADVTGA